MQLHSNRHVSPFVLHLKARGGAKRGEANKSDEMMAMKGDGGQGRNGPGFIEFVLLQEDGAPRRRAISSERGAEEGGGRGWGREGLAEGDE